MSKNTKKLLSYYKPYLKLLVLDMICAFIVALISLLVPLCVRYVTNDLLATTTISFKQIGVIGLGMFILAIINYVCNYFITYKGHLMGAYMERDMRRELFEHYQKLSFDFYDKQQTGVLMSRLTNGLSNMSELYHHGPEDIIISLIRFIGSFVILVRIDLTLTLVVFSILPIMIFFTVYCNSKMRKAFTLNKQRTGEINARIEDSLLGIRIVKSFTNEESELEKFSINNENFVESKRQTYKAMATFESGLNIFALLITVIVIVFGTFNITTGTIIVGNLLIFLLNINNFTEPIEKMIQFTERYQLGMTGYNRFMEILEIKPKIRDKENAKPLANVQGKVEFKNVSFRYNKKLDYALKNINFTVQKGEHIAIIGPNGAGKSTLCALLPRFYEIENGTILIDNQNIQDVTVKSLRESIGIVQQNLYMFSGTVMDNIRYGNPSASDEEVIEAAKKANAHEFIMGFSQGYQTNIHQSGVNLSGGQKQRISIARVFLKNPPILIFDEATSALDNENEKGVQDSLEALSKGRTTFVVVHRLSTIKNVKRIIVLTDDGIVEEGNHEELLAKNGIYASFYNMKFE